MVTDLPSSFEQVTLVGYRARIWLLEVCEHICADAQTPMSSILQTFVGCWICEQALVPDTGERDILSLAREVQKRFDDLEEQETFSALLSSDAALVLLSAGILRALDSKSATIELFVQEVASNVQTTEDQDQTDTAELFAARFLLNCLHLHPDPGTYSISTPRISPPTNLFQADESVVRSLAADIAASTAYGQRPPLAEPKFLEQLAVVLPVWMLYYLRQHNLEIGTLLLRTMNYLHLQGDPAFQMGLNFVLAQQQPDGRFGFLAPEISQLRSTKPQLDEVLELYLPITISCLWAIAEVTNPDFILFRSI